MSIKSIEVGIATVSKFFFFFSIKFSHISRRFNRVVHHLPKFDFESAGCFEWADFFSC